MGYIQELRKYVGHQPILLVGAGVLVIDDQGRLLMHFRPDNHLWGIPGGATELGETVEDTARRETQEETGLLLGALALFGVFSGPELHYVYPNGDEVHNVSIVYECRQYEGTLNGSKEESLNARFFSPGEIDLNTVSQPVRPVLKKWLERSSLP